MLVLEVIQWQTGGFPVMSGMDFKLITMYTFWELFYCVTLKCYYVPIIEKLLMLSFLENELVL